MMPKRIHIPCDGPLVERPTLVLGDLYGNHHALEGNLEAADAVDANLDWTRSNTDLVLIGDVLFDRGVDDIDIIETLESLRAQVEATGGRFRMVLGNHEWVGIDFFGFGTYNLPLPGQFRGMCAYDEVVKGGPLRNVAAVAADFLNRKYDKDQMKAYRDTFVQTAEGAATARLFKSMELSFVSGSTLFVHTVPRKRCLAMLTHPNHEEMKSEWVQMCEQLFDPNQAFDKSRWKNLQGHLDALLAGGNRSIHQENFTRVATELAQLRQAGVRCMVHGHDANSDSHFKFPNGIHTLNADRAYRHRFGSKEDMYSIVMLQPDGEVQYDFEC